MSQLNAAHCDPTLIRRDWIPLKPDKAQAQKCSVPFEPSFVQPSERASKLHPDGLTNFAQVLTRWRKIRKSGNKKSWQKCWWSDLLPLENTKIKPKKNNRMEINKKQQTHFCYFFLQVLFSSHSCFDTLTRDNSASLQPLGSIRCQHND